MTTPVYLPPVRSVGLAQPLTWLARGLNDLTHAGWVSWAHGLAAALFGLGVSVLAYRHFWLLAGVLSAFLVVGPVLATSFYALSRALERQQRADWGVVRRTWLGWQRSHPRAWREHDYWCLVEFGLLLALAALGWIVVSASLITLLAPEPVNDPMDFVRHVVLAEGGWLFELWLALGSLLVAPIFASSVVAMPLLLDRKATLSQAVLTSWMVVLANPVPMAFWAALMLALTLLGLGTVFFAYIVAIPVLGQASWHAYRDLVDASGLPERGENVA